MNDENTSSVESRSATMGIGDGTMIPALEVDTPMGTLVAYPSIDPDNPGIFIDLRPQGETVMLNLSGTECQVHKDTGESTLKTHVWGNGDQEDTTHDITHENVKKYFTAD